MLLQLDFDIGFSRCNIFMSSATGLWDSVFFCRLVADLFQALVNVCGEPMLQLRFTSDEDAHVLRDGLL